MLCLEAGKLDDKLLIPPQLSFGKLLLYVNDYWLMCYIVLYFVRFTRVSQSSQNCHRRRHERSQPRHQSHRIMGLVSYAVCHSICFRTKPQCNGCMPAFLSHLTRSLDTSDWLTAGSLI